MSTRHKIIFGLIKSSSLVNNCRLRNLNRNKNDACLVADQSHSRALVLRLVRTPAQLRRTRRLLELDDDKHMQKNQINSNEQPNKHHDMIEHDFYESF